MDTAADNQHSEQVNTASGGSSAFITPYELHTTTLYAFPILEAEPAAISHKRDDGRTSTKAELPISEDALRRHLEAKHSPLSDHVAEILGSPYWSTIIAICTIEQYGCSRLPGGDNWNLWGIGGASELRTYSTAEEGIGAIDALLTRYEARGYDTIEELNGYYVQPASDNWYRVVTQTKAHLEAL